MWMALEDSVSGSGKLEQNNGWTAEEYIFSSLEVNPDTLMSYSQIILIVLCSEQHLSIVGQKKVLVQHLIQWVCLIVTV
jgi:hypothetical protein